MTRSVLAVRTRSARPLLIAMSRRQLTALPRARRCCGARFLSQFYRDLACGVWSNQGRHSTNVLVAAIFPPYDPWHIASRRFVRKVAT
jgi:hypothetical protein